MNVFSSDTILFFASQFYVIDCCLQKGYRLPDYKPLDKRQILLHAVESNGIQPAGGNGYGAM
jgi:hypothetical protein